MRRAILLTGFNNWGKTTHIINLFSNENRQRQRFHFGHHYTIQGVHASFTVETHSNDDFGQKQYIEALENRIKESDDRGKNLFGAFCPTRWQRSPRGKTNDCLEILGHPPLSRYDEVYLFYLRFKWDHHAELNINEI